VIAGIEVVYKLEEGDTIIGMGMIN